MSSVVWNNKINKFIFVPINLELYIRSINGYNTYIPPLYISSLKETKEYISTLINPSNTCEYSYLSYKNRPLLDYEDLGIPISESEMNYILSFLRFTKFFDNSQLRSLCNSLGLDYLILVNGVSYWCSIESCFDNSEKGIVYFYCGIPNFYTANNKFVYLDNYFSRLSSEKISMCKLYDFFVKKYGIVKNFLELDVPQCFDATYKNKNNCGSFFNLG